MITIKEAIEHIQKEEGCSKYHIATHILDGTQPIMIDRYLNNEVKSPQKKICLTIFKRYGLEVFPYTKEELENE